MPTIERQAAKPLEELVKQYPVVTVLGPRQLGKTTLVRQRFADYPYINLENPDIRELAANDPRAIFNQYPDRLIIDEIQRVPELLSYIQTIVDEKHQEGLYILTGSHQLALHEALSQSLAGRTAVLQLLPLSLAELQAAQISMTLHETLLTGFYPRLYQKSLDPTQSYRNYIKTYLERDVRQMINLRDLLTFQRFMKLCAGRVASLLNVSNLANEVGVSSHTINHWLSILQASYLIELIPPYHENFGKRMIKSPKLYFTDVGLACYLLGIESVAHIERDPLRGQLFENMVMMELIKTRTNQALDPNLYFYRDVQQHELDAVYQDGHQLVAIEIKSAQTLRKGLLKGVHYFRQMIGERCQDSYLIYAGEQTFCLEEVAVINYRHAAQAVKSTKQ